MHHVAVPASLLAKGKNDLLAIVKGPDHSEQIFVFHGTGGHTNVLKIPSSLGLPLAGGRTVPIETLSLHSPDTIIAGLDHLGIPVTHYVGVDLHAVDPASNLGQLATGKLSITSMISDPTGTTTLLEQVASHIYLGPGTPVSAVLSLMNVPTAHPVSVPDRQGRARQGRPRVGVRHGPAQLPLVATQARPGQRHPALASRGCTSCSTTSASDEWEEPATGPDRRPRPRRSRVRRRVPRRGAP